MVLAGTLNDPAAFTPAMEIYRAGAQPWVDSGGDRPRFDKMPPPSP